MSNNKAGLKTADTDTLVLSGARQTPTEWLSDALSGFLFSHPLLSCLSLGYYGPTYMPLSYTIRAQYIVKHIYLKRLLEYSPVTVWSFYVLSNASENT